MTNGNYNDKMVERNYSTVGVLFIGRLIIINIRSQRRRKRTNTGTEFENLSEAISDSMN